MTSPSSERSFQSVIHQLVAGSTGNYATFYLMNTTRNRNGWGVTKQALEEALPTVIKKPLGCGPDYKIDKHYPSPMAVGVFTETDMPGSYALGTAKISDDFVWGELKAGRWGPISVVVASYRETCSKCSESLIAVKNPYDHDCIKNKDAYMISHSFKFKRIDLVDDPAYPQAGLQDLGGSAEDSVLVPLELCASFYESQSTGQANVSLNHVGIEKKMDDKEIEQLQARVKELEAAAVTATDDAKKLETLEKEKSDLEAKVKELENPDENPEIKSLTERIAAMDEEKHQSILTACVEARFKAGLATDKTVEAKALEDFDNGVLKFMTLEAGKVEAMKRANNESGPQWKYSPTGQTDLEASMTTQRATFGFPARKLEATA